MVAPVGSRGRANAGGHSRLVGLNLAGATNSRAAARIQNAHAHRLLAQRAVDINADAHVAERNDSVHKPVVRRLRFATLACFRLARARAHGHHAAGCWQPSGGVGRHRQPQQPLLAPGLGVPGCRVPPCSRVAKRRVTG